MPNPAPKRVFVLTVMDARNHAELKLCLKSKRFRLLNQAEEEALEYLRKHRISAVVYDNDFGHNHWRGFFDKTRKINDRPPKVIVASRNADERFWIDWPKRGRRRYRRPSQTVLQGRAVHRGINRTAIGGTRADTQSGNRLVAARLGKGRYKPPP